MEIWKVLEGARGGVYLLSLSQVPFCSSLVPRYPSRAQALVESRVALQVTSWTFLSLRDWLIVLKKGRRVGGGNKITKQNKKGENHKEIGSGAAELAAFSSLRVGGCLGARLHPSHPMLGATRLPPQRGWFQPRAAQEGAGQVRPTYHDSGRGRCCLGGHRGLVGLVLCSFDFGLQVCRRVKIFAFLPHATPLYVIHTNGYGVVVCVDHGAVCGVCKAAVGLSAGTIASLEFPADLRAQSTGVAMQGRPKPPVVAPAQASSPQGLSGKVSKWVTLEASSLLQSQKLESFNLNSHSPFLSLKFDSALC